MKKEETLIEATNLSKKFSRDLKKSLWYGVKDTFSEVLNRKSLKSIRESEFWALNDLSFTLKRGECLGLLGRNGAGKTTLLKVLSGLIAPDKGEVVLHGKLGGLIALGAGFNPILTGKENIYINGAILGYSIKYIDERYDEIVEFSELHDFIDTPVQNYSSGMSVRLGFAIASVLTKPDILLLDEVLAVGDIGFTTKCLNSVKRMMQDSAVIFVSHNMQFISQFCTRIILLDDGRLLGDYSTASLGIEKYLSLFQAKQTNVLSDKVTISDFELFSQNHSIPTLNPSIEQYDTLSLKFKVSIRNNKRYIIKLYLMDQVMSPVISFNLENYPPLAFGTRKVNLDLGSMELSQGRYSFVLGITDYENDESEVRLEGVLPFIVNAKIYDWAHIIKRVTPNIINDGIN